jgi:hypothetical protein
MCLAETYVADVDDRSGLAARSGKVSEGVRRSGCSRRATVESTGRSTTETAAKATTTSKLLSTKATSAAHETSTRRELLTESSTTSHEAAATTAEARWTSETVLSDFEDTAVPVISVELLDGDLSIVRVVESDDTRALHAAVGGDVNVSTDDSASVSYTIDQYIVHTLWVQL